LATRRVSVFFGQHIKVGEVADLFKGKESTVLYSWRHVVISCIGVNIAEKLCDITRQRMPLSCGLR
jgi:hypothetical protein